MTVPLSDTEEAPSSLAEAMTAGVASRNCGANAATTCANQFLELGVGA